MKRLIPVLCTLLLAGCTQGPIAETDMSPPDICGIVSPNVLNKLLGEDYTSGPLIDMREGADGCKYVAQTEPSDEARVFNFILRTANSEAQTESEYLRAINFWVNSDLSHRAYEHLDDIGTKAFVAYAAKSPQLITYEGNNLLIITFGNFNEDNKTILPQLRFTAKDILETLQST